MPLHREHEVTWGRSLQRFDDSVLRRPRDHPQSIPGRVSGLVMAGIHRNDKFYSPSEVSAVEVMIRANFDPGSASMGCATATFRPAS